MGLDTNTRVLWFGAHADIPANWTRDTDFDARYLQGDATPGTNGGSSSHNHTISGTHDHTQDSHLHNISLGGSVGGASLGRAIFTSPWAAERHAHPAVNIPADTVSTGNTSVTVSSDSNDPLVRLTIIIKPDDGNQEVPINAVGFFGGSSIPTGFTLKSGMEDKFVSAPGTGGDGGGTGGLATHDHTGTASSHTHATDFHNHTNTAFKIANADTTVSRDLGSQDFSNLVGHHTATNFQTLAITSQSTTPVINSTSTDPAFYQLLAIENTGASQSTPEGIILPSISATPPAGWLLCDGTNGTPDLSAVQIKVTENYSKIGDTGGSNTHTHKLDDHLHTYDAHGHTYTLNTSTKQITNGSLAMSLDTHNHFGTASTSSTAPTMQDTSLTAGTGDIRPPYRTVAFMMKATAPTVHIKGGNILGGDIAAI